MRAPLVITFAAGALAAGCGKTETSGNQPPPPGTFVVGNNPPALPSWDAIESQHHGTNPPSAVLIVDTHGGCYKKWEGGMAAPGPNRIEDDCASGRCGMPVSCPEGAASLRSGGPAEIPKERAIEIATAAAREGGKVAPGMAGTAQLGRGVYMIVFKASDAGGAPDVLVRVDAISGKVLGVHSRG